MPCFCCWRKKAAEHATASESEVYGPTEISGNPRNKCVLEPGHSLMDWIRLGNSGKDLTGVGARAGKMTVSPDEVVKHNTREDAWMVIRGNVYNVTEYLSFHPGGLDEIMKGVGLEDATALFDGVHPWVNYEKMLTKCYIGRVGFSPAPVDITAGTPTKNSSPSETKRTSTTSELPDVLQRRTITPLQEKAVRFDWIQKHDVLTLYFYTGAYSNPNFEVRGPKDGEWVFAITVGDCVIVYKFKPFGSLRYPPSFKVHYETGKIEVHFEKEAKQTWPSCGIMDRAKRIGVAQSYKKEYVVKERILLNETTFILSLQSVGQDLSTPPLGYDIWLYNDKGDAREYTPVPHFFSTKDITEMKPAHNCSLKTFVIRRIPNGMVSDYLFRKSVGDTVYGAETVGTFDLQTIAEKQYFLCLGGGVGLTPFLSVIQFLLEKKVKSVIKVVLVNFNRSKEHQFLLDAFTLMQTDKRFVFVPVLTRPPSNYDGISGLLDATLMDQLLASEFSEVALADIFMFCCGPSPFNHACYQQLKRLGASMINAHFFVSSSNQEQAIRISDITPFIAEVQEAGNKRYFKRVRPHGTHLFSLAFVCGLFCPIKLANVRNGIRDFLGLLRGRQKPK